MKKGQVSWITGASSGIGEAVAQLLATDGHKLILSARRRDELDRVKALCLQAGASDEDVYVLVLDMTDFDIMAQKVQEAQSQFGRIDFLFNNAGISQRSLCVDSELHTYRTLFEVDVFGQIALTKLVLPIMLAQGSGHLSVTASVAGKVGVPYRTGYCAAKHAMMGFFDALRAEVARENIYVSTVTPGFIRTNISNKALNGDGSEFGKMDQDIQAGMDVAQAASKIVKGWKKGRPEIAVGKGMEMHALWIKRFFPKLLQKIVARKAAPI
ncbi:SDR family oxidoreductase [Thalassomonas actiniarum]|uniref:SDR family oxidoreductase n=1 Tax=Thalassomonas actiniarum TaxID=485447 RepID=A0AAF0C6N7_9GAMM|nr:SDR family oxidoreductase [Thalassomonas actiniarum]WDE02295.1 SDR family oxidoreductase [Thalassomonas actiniarum]